MLVADVRALGLELRVGLHTGECERHDGKLTGIAVPVGARVASTAAPGEVLVSSTVKDLVAGSGLEFEDRGVYELKGVPGEWRLYAVRALRRATPRAATSTSPIRSSATARSTSSSCPAGSRTSSSPGRSRARALPPAPGVVLAADPVRQARHRALGSRAVDRLPTLEERMDDVRAVMDAAGSERAALFGVSEGGPMSVLFAATYPRAHEGARARSRSTPSGSGAPTIRGRRRREAREAELEMDRARLGRTVRRSMLAPSVATSAFRQRAARTSRRSASPGAAVALLRMNSQIDVRDVLPDDPRADARPPPRRRSRRERRGGALDRRAQSRGDVRRAPGRRPPPLGRRRRRGSSTRSRSS